MKTYFTTLVLLTIVAFVGCSNGTVVQLPESSFDGKGIDIVKMSASETMTKDMVDGREYYSGPMTVVIKDDPSVDDRWLASWRGPKPGSPEYLAAKEQRAADRVKKLQAKADAIAAAETQRKLAEEVLGPDKRWFAGWRTARNVSQAD